MTPKDSLIFDKEEIQSKRSKREEHVQDTTRVSFCGQPIDLFSQDEKFLSLIF